MKVFLAAAAERDLREITAYIARDNPLAAYNFVRFLRAKAIGLGDIPHAFPLVPRYERSGIRRRPCGNYLIFYRIERGGVRIVRVLHGARNYETLLFPSGEVDRLGSNRHGLAMSENPHSIFRWSQKMKRVLSALPALAVLLLLGSCGKPKDVGDFAGSTPPFDPVAFWTGHTRSWGVVENRDGAPTETIETDCVGTAEPDGLHMVQTLTEGDGTVRHRDWHLRRIAAGRFSATANDMAGVAQGQAAGRVFHWDWVWRTKPGNGLKDMTMHQWMYLLADGSMMNRTVITKLGITIAQVTEHFVRASP